MEHIISSYWKYLIDVLKVSHVLSFINSNQMDEETRAQLSPYLRLCKTNNERDKEFCDKCVYKIANIIYATIDAQKAKDGTEAYKDSKFYAPRENLLKTEDENILVIGNVDKSNHRNFVDIVEWEVVTGYEYIYPDEDDFYAEPRRERYEYDIPIDAAYEIAKHLINLMNTQGRSGYENKICHIKWNSFCNFNEKEVEWIYSYRTKGWYQYKCKLTNGTFKYNAFTNFINHSLRTTYPDVFPILEGENGKKRFTVFWDKEERKKDIERIIEEQEKEQRIRNAIIEEERRREEEAENERILREMERSDFWDELGDSSVNIIDC